MSRIKSFDTNPEKRTRSLLHKMGYRFRVHVKNLVGKPDIVLRRHRKIIFVHGCFWHGHKDCKRSSKPTSNMAFWDNKIEKNKKRDLKIKKELKLQGWKILEVWQCQTRNQKELVARLSNFMDKDKKIHERA